MSGKPVVFASVREVVHFVLRTGNLGGTGGFSARDRALEGTRGHQRLQKSRPVGYEAEVPIQWRVEEETFAFELKGRIDGVLVDGSTLLIEEIKTFRGERVRSADPLHWAQAKIYACVYAREHGFDEATVRLSYLELESNETIEFEEKFALSALQEFFDSVLREYLDWVRAHRKWCNGRDESIRAMAFPFSKYRAGQRQLGVAVYRTIKNRTKLFAEAPTGIGKTVSVLFPAIKAMGEKQVEKIFYLTAKTVGRAVAERCAADLRSQGLKFRSLTITARDKICFREEHGCDLNQCPFAMGYYDRIKSALRDALEGEQFDRPQIEALAKKHQVCPFELSLDLSEWVDLVICDYNYVFDPSASLKRYFDEEKHDYAILIDEAHNLLDRAREMFSAELEVSELLQVKESIADELPSCAKAIGKICTRLNRIGTTGDWVARDNAIVSVKPPDKFEKLLETFLEQAELWLVRNEPARFRETLLEAYFRVLAFQRTLGVYNERYLTLFEKDVGRLRLFCIDPSEWLNQALERTGPAVFFSATLSPLEYFRDSLGATQLEPMLQLDSPFPPENLSVLVQDQISTRFKSRAESYDAVAEAIHKFTQTKRGNYLAYFPSYGYMREVEERFEKLGSSSQVEVQSSGMSEQQREAFVAKFAAGGEQTLIGFAVLGGLFGEGIDLVGERLIGVIVVGVGLPQICLERDLIKEYCQKQGRAGFDYAYTFPGMNRVLQAVGRLIRSEADRGVVLLIDDRFAQLQYRKLFPRWWNRRKVGSNQQIGGSATEFWEPAMPSTKKESGPL